MFTRYETRRLFDNLGERDTRTKEGTSFVAGEIGRVGRPPSNLYQRNRARLRQRLGFQHFPYRHGIGNGVA